VDQTVFTLLRFTTSAFSTSEETTDSMVTEIVTLQTSVNNCFTQLCTGMALATHPNGKIKGIE